MTSLVTTTINTLLTPVLTVWSRINEWNEAVRYQQHGEYHDTSTATSSSTSSPHNPLHSHDQRIPADLPSFVIYLLDLCWYHWLLTILVLCAVTFGTKRILRWPVLLLLCTTLALELTLYIVIRYVVYLIERFFRASHGSSKRVREEVRDLRKKMMSAQTYTEWASYAKKADTLLGHDTWKQRADSRYYNSPLLKKILNELRTARQQHDVPKLIATLQATCFHKNPCGILNEMLYSKSLIGTKDVIEEYVEEVLECLVWMKERGVNGDVGVYPRDGRGDEARQDSNDTDVAAASSSASHQTHQPQRTTSTRKRSLSRSTTTPSTTVRRRASTSRTRPSRVSRSRMKESEPQEDRQENGLSNGNDEDTDHPQSNGHSRSSAKVHPHQPHPPSSSSSSSSIPSSPTSAIPRSLSDLLLFYQSAKRQYGCTALCLSGGASLGNYHWGTVLALLNEDLLPRLISGTSSGAVVAAAVCTRTDDELRAMLTVPELNAHLTSFEESWFPTCAVRFLRERVMYDQKKWLEKLAWYAHNHSPSLKDGTQRMTFLEAYHHTRGKRILNITCTSQRKHNPSMLLNYLTTPNVCIDSAILASAAVPGFINPVVLMEKINGQIQPYHEKDLQWCDGSLQRDLPLSELAEQFGANFFLVSQLNPHIIPFFFNSRGQSGVPSRWRSFSGGYRGGFLLSALELFLKEDMKKNMRVLSELDILPSIMGSDFSSLFLQDFQGQITLVPNASFHDYLHLISDPSAADIQNCLTEGRLTAWRKFEMIRNRVRVGECLTKLIWEVKREMGEKQNGGNGSGRSSINNEQQHFSTNTSSSSSSSTTYYDDDVEPLDDSRAIQHDVSRNRRRSQEMDRQLASMY